MALQSTTVQRRRTTPRPAVETMQRGHEGRAAIWRWCGGCRDTQEANACLQEQNGGAACGGAPHWACDTTAERGGEEGVGGWRMRAAQRVRTGAGVQKSAERGCMRAAGAQSAERGRREGGACRKDEAAGHDTCDSGAAVRNKGQQDVQTVGRDGRGDHGARDAAASTTMRWGTKMVGQGARQQGRA
ncbi:hypothetical protein DENSPDRAFT_855218 [Dentipellis sp. KUC8613]|nr:hypothetical protein DENSPDRAFT_855218 [Dentipellis sp. KUC8613]